MVRRKATPAVEAKPVEIDGIPTAHGLTLRDRTLATYGREGSKIYISPAGHAVLGKALRAKAQYELEEGITDGVNGKQYDRDGNLIT